jgi:hypothetical protein
VLGDGKLLEFDTPAALLKNDRSEFSMLVKQTGTAEAEHLRMMADNVASKVLSVSVETTDEENDEDNNPMQCHEQDPLL